MEALIQGPFAAVLQRNRDQFNAKFKAARHTSLRLDPVAFANHLRSAVAPIVEAAAREFPERTDQVANVLYDLSLELLGKGLLGVSAKYPAVAAAWERLFLTTPRLLATGPQRFTGCVVNALYNLSTTEGARPGEWIEVMSRIGRTCGDVDTYLRVGKIVAWRCGMADLRNGALVACKEIPEQLADAALGLAESVPVEPVLRRLADDPWFKPGRQDKEKQLEIVAVAGSFRGFGGLFVAPPRVTVSDERFCVTDGQGAWLLTADVFGATFRRIGAAPQAANPKTKFRVDTEGQIRWGTRMRTFAELETVTSFAANETTLVVTTALSHSVYLVAVTGGAA